MKGRPPSSIWAAARAAPCTWLELGYRPRSDIRRKRVDDGYTFKLFEGIWWVSYVGQPVDIEVNPSLL